MKKACALLIFGLLCWFQVSWAGDVEILSINDLHGWVEEAGASIGMAKLSTFITQFKVQHPEAIVVSGGDNYQGEALSNLSRGDLINELFGLIGLKVSAVGNHEFDWGADRFGRWNSSGLQYVAANIVDEKNRREVSWVKPYMIVQSGEHKIAFIGLSTRETTGATAAKHLIGLKFENAPMAAARWVRYLQEGRDKQGVPDAIILLTHVPSFQEPLTSMITGAELDELTRLKGVDAIITGHSHKSVAGRRQGVPIVQAACYGKAVGVLHLKFEGRGLRRIIPEVIALKDLAAGLAPDPEVQASTASYRQRLEGIIDRKVCRLNSPLPFERRTDMREMALGYLICNAVRNQTGVQVALVNNGAIRRGLAAGDVTYGDIMGVFPFDDYIVRLRLSGKDLRTLIVNTCLDDSPKPCQFAGLRLKVRPGQLKTQRLRALELEDGTPIIDSAHYTLAVPDYMFEGGDGHNFASAREVEYIYVQLRDMLVEYLGKCNEVRAPEISGLYQEAWF